MFSAASISPNIIKPPRGLPRQGDASVDFLWLLLVLTLVRGVIYAVLNPPFGSPDEAPHVQYIANLATGGASGPRGDEGHQPISYYALMAPAYWLTAGHSPDIQDLAIRLASLPFLLGIVLFTWLAGQKMAPGQPFVPTVASALVALQPELAYVTASANNDSAANLAAAILVYLAVSLLTGGPFWTVPTMVIAIVGSLMTKGQVLPLTFLCSLLLLAHLTRRGFTHRSRWLLLAMVLLALGTALAVTTPSGSIMLGRIGTRLSLFTIPWSNLVKAASRFGPETLGYQHETFWAAFLGESVHPAPILYAGPTLCTLFGLLGYGVWLVRSRCLSVSLDSRLVLRIILSLAVTVQLLAMYLSHLAIVSLFPTVSYLLQTMQGRYLFTVLVPLALLVAEGWSLILAPRHRWTAAPTLVVVFAVFDASALMSFSQWYGWAPLG